MHCVLGVAFFACSGGCYIFPLCFLSAPHRPYNPLCEPVCRGCGIGRKANNSHGCLNPSPFWKTATHNLKNLGKYEKQRMNHSTRCVRSAMCGAAGSLLVQQLFVAVKQRSSLCCRTFFLLRTKWAMEIALLQCEGMVTVGQDMTQATGLCSTYQQLCWYVCTDITQASCRPVAVARGSSPVCIHAAHLICPHGSHTKS